MKMKAIKYLLTILFLLFSFYFITPMMKQARSQFHSAELTKKEYNIDSKTTRVDYLDSNGRIFIAADLGYASAIVTKENKTEVEEYFDNEGKPISRYSGYYAIRKEYDDFGNVNRITYLDENRQPKMISDGYAIEEYNYNNMNQIVMIKYYDTGRKPISTVLYGYGRENEYNDKGKISKIIYLDAYGAPAITGRGYAMVERYYYCTSDSNNGKVEREFYFDEKGIPISLTLGQYGIQKEYNIYGQNIIITYLDADGHPIVTNKGYTTVVHTFKANGNIASEQYFDLEGKPFSIAEGQYGIKNDNGQTFFLDQNGHIMFNIKNLLYNQSWLVIILALTIVVLAGCISREWNVILLFTSIVVVLYFTLMFRESGDGKGKIYLFYSYNGLFLDNGKIAEVLKNIWLFVPLGAILYCIYPQKRMFAVFFAFSIFIETIQYMTATGCSSLDDVISNTIGGLIGFESEKQLSMIFENIRSRIKKYTIE